MYTTLPKNILLKMMLPSVMLSVPLCMLMLFDSIMHSQRVAEYYTIQVAGRHQELVANSPSDSAADNTDPLKPRFSLTANKCESNGSEQSFHLMIFGGIFKYQDPVTKDSKEIVLAETKVLTLGKRNYSKEEHYDMHDELFVHCLFHTCSLYIHNSDFKCKTECSDTKHFELKVYLIFVHCNFISTFTINLMLIEPC